MKLTIRFFSLIIGSFILDWSCEGYVLKQIPKFLILVKFKNKNAKKIFYNERIL